MARRKTPESTSPGPRVSVVPIGEVALDPANLRVRDARATASLDASVRRFGPARSIVLDAAGVVRAGNGTLESAERAGCKEVLIVEPAPGQVVAVRRGDWSPTEATAYAIADNRTGELAGWDNLALAETLRSLQSEEIELDAVGFSETEIDDLIGRLGDEALGDEPAPPPAPDPEPAVGQYGVIVICRDEAEQRSVYERLDGEGLTCRVVCV